MSTLLATLALTLFAFTVFWAVSLRLRDASIVDFWWGPGFVLIGWVAFALERRPDTGQHIGQLVLLAALTLWGMRLGWYMMSRHRGVEDARYAKMRAEHGERFRRNSLWLVFWLQAVIQWIASSPVLTAALVAPRPSLLISAAGLVVFTTGFLLEVWADNAVSNFKADPRNRGKLLMTGLHSRIRHPNYLGEIVLQWGLGLLAFGIAPSLLAFLGPALMTGLLIKLSGVPMLEAEMAQRPGFAEWKARTGALLPKLRR